MTKAAHIINSNLPDCKAGSFARQGIHINRKQNYKQIRIRRRRFTSINL